MIKLQSLTQFLISLNLVDANNIDAWTENPRIIPRATVKSGDGVVLYTQTYDAVINIERFPYQRHPAELLFAHVCSWLFDHDADRDEIAQPNIDVDIIDDFSADIEITISFEEDVEGVEDSAGPITLNGKQYSLADVVVDVAETGEVTT